MSSVNFNVNNIVPQSAPQSDTRPTEVTGSKFGEMLEKMSETSTSTNEDFSTKIKELAEKIMSGEDIGSAIEELSPDDLENLDELLSKMLSAFNDLLAELTGGEDMQVSNIFELFGEGTSTSEEDETTSLLDNIIEALTAKINEINTTAFANTQDIQSVLAVLMGLIGNNGSDTTTLLNTLQNNGLTKSFNSLTSMENQVNLLGELLNVTEITVKGSGTAQTSDLSFGQIISEATEKFNFENQGKMQEQNETNGELAELIVNADNRTTTFTPVAENAVQTPNVGVQVSDFVQNTISTLQVGESSELIMQLNPENLGNLSIKIVKTAAEISISIVAQNSLTQQLIEDQLPNLISALTHNSEETVNVTVVTPNDNLSEFMNHTDSNSEHNQSGENSFSSGNNGQIDGISEENTNELILERTDELWQTV